MPRQSTRLRERLAGSRMLIAPGAYDCITARAVERAGFEAAYMTGSGTAASLGFPDYGLVTMSEMVANAGRMAAVLGIPLIADGDTGYGNELNVTRTIREYERSGVAAIHIEDQDFPKKCGHLADKTVIDAEAYVSKIRAAVAARRDPDFVVIARTDARAVAGLDAAVSRANAALAAGADVAFVEAPQSLEEMAAIPKLVRGPCLLNIVWRGKTPPIGFREAEEMGYRVAILPSILFKTVMGAADAILDQAIRESRHPVPTGDIGIGEGVKRVGGEEWDRIQETFAARRRAP